MLFHLETKRRRNRNSEFHVVLRVTSANSRECRPPPPWATFDEILEKLFFLAVSGDGEFPAKVSIGWSL